MKEHRYACNYDECSYTNPYEHGLEEHINMKHKHIIRYTCDKCGFGAYYKSNNKGDLKKHVKSVHEKSNNYKCPIENCEFVTQHRHSLNYHINYHKTELTCAIEKCDYIAINKPGLTKHKSEKHKVFPYNCDNNKCSYGTLYSHALERHKCQHENDYEFKCIICNFTSHNMQQLGIHYANHHTAKQRTCPYENCQFIGNNIKSAKKHYIHHTSQYTYKCQLCNFTAKRKQLLGRHKNSCH